MGINKLYIFLRLTTPKSPGNNQAAFNNCLHWPFFFLVRYMQKPRLCPYPLSSPAGPIAKHAGRFPGQPSMFCYWGKGAALAVDELPENPFFGRAIGFANGTGA
jgi:hypothetical protein